MTRRPVDRSAHRSARTLAHTVAWLALALCVLSPLAATGLAESADPVETGEASDTVDRPRLLIRIIDDGTERDSVTALVRALEATSDGQLEVERVAVNMDGGVDRQIELLERAAADDVQVVVLVPAEAQMLAPYATLVNESGRLVTFAGSVAGVPTLDPNAETIESQALELAERVVDESTLPRKAMIEVASFAAAPQWIGDGLGLARGPAVRLDRSPEAARRRMRSLLASQREIILVHAGDALAANASIAAIADAGRTGEVRVISDAVDAALAGHAGGDLLAGVVVPDLFAIAEGVRELARTGAMPDTSRAVVFVDARNRTDPEVERLLALWGSQ